MPALQFKETKMPQETLIYIQQVSSAFCKQEGWQRASQTALGMASEAVSSPGMTLWGNPPAKAEDACLIPDSERLPCRRKWQPTPVCLPGKSHGQRSLLGYSPRGCKRVDMTERLRNNKKDAPAPLWSLQVLGSPRIPPRPQQLRVPIASEAVPTLTRQQPHSSSSGDEGSWGEPMGLPSSRIVEVFALRALSRDLVVTALGWPWGPRSRASVEDKQIKSVFPLSYHSLQGPLAANSH